MSKTRGTKSRVPVSFKKNTKTPKRPSTPRRRRPSEAQRPGTHLEDLEGLLSGRPGRQRFFQSLSQSFSGPNRSVDLFLGFSRVFLGFIVFLKGLLVFSRVFLLPQWFFMILTFLGGGSFSY